MKKILYLSLFLIYTQICYGFSYDECNTVDYKTENIKLGSCNLNVYIAKTYSQKLCGMLKFTDETFKADGMLFTGDEYIKHYFHTNGMKMNIRIAGVNKIQKGVYKLNGEALYSPPGLSSIKIYGTDVFETSEKKYQQYIKKCISSGADK